MCLLSCGAGLAQIILFIFNFLLSLVSLAVTGLGIYVLIQVGKVSEVDVEYANSLPIIMIVVGCVFTVIFFCGCCGAFIRNKCMLTTYAVISILLATALVVFTVFVFKGAESAKNSKEVLTDTFSNPQNAEALNLLETALKCCGTSGPGYYNSTSIPISCCPGALNNLQNLNQATISTSDDFILSCATSDAYQNGCVDVLIDLLSEILKISGQVLIWIIIIEYVAAFLAGFLACYVK